MRTSTQRLRDRIAALPPERRTWAALPAAAREVTAGLTVLAEATCYDHCRTGVLVQDPEGVWPLLVPTREAVLITNPFMQDLGEAVPYPTVWDALLHLLVPPALGRRNEWLEGLLAVDYLNAHPEFHLPGLSLLAGLAGREIDLTEDLAVQRTVQTNLAHGEALQAAFKRALRKHGIRSKNTLERILDTAQDACWLADILSVEDRSEWPGIAEWYVDEWDYRGRPARADW